MVYKELVTPEETTRVYFHCKETKEEVGVVRDVENGMEKRGNVNSGTPYNISTNETVRSGWSYIQGTSVSEN